jgi:hypothetical protein
MRMLTNPISCVAVSRAREDAVLFTNSTDQLRAALDRSVDKEMAIEALRQGGDGNFLYRGESENVLSPTNQANVEQVFELNNSHEERTRNDQASEEMELSLDS